MAAKPNKRRREELEFLPAALEAMETPRSPTARILSLGIAGMISAALIWSFIGTLDVVVIGRGQLAPIGDVKVVQSKELGIVVALHVQEGSQVEAGDTLVELDRSEQRIMLENARRHWIEASLEVARLEAELAALKGEDTVFEPPKEATAELVAVQRKQLQANVEALRLALEKLNFSRKSRQEQLDSLTVQIDKVTDQLEHAEEREESARKLLEQGYATRITWLQYDEARLKLQKDLEIARHDRRRAEIERAQADGAIEALYAGQRKDLFEKLTAAQNRAAEAKKQTERLRAVAGRFVLRAPSSGVVQDLEITTIGGVVGPQRDLMRIVPINRTLEVRILVENKDIGFIKDGQKAAVKVDSFPFTTYDFLDGQVTTIGQDATEQDGRMAFPVRLSLVKSEIMFQGRPVKLSPGMSVAAEIKVRKRRIIDFFLDPITKHWREGLREP